MEEIKYLPKTMLEILENSDLSGRVNWVHCLTGQAKELCLSLAQIEGDLQKKYKMACYMFGSISLYNYREDFITEEYLNKLDPKMTISDDNNYCYFSANASIVTGMLGLQPYQEVKDLYGFFQDVKKVFNNFYTHFNTEDCDLHLVLEKKSGKDLLSGIKFSYCGDMKRADKEELSPYESFLEKELANLKKKILTNRNVLSWYMFNQKILNKSKTDKKMLFATDNFFEREENPYFLRYDEQVKELKKQQPPPIKIEDKYLYFINENYSVKSLLKNKETPSI